MSIIEVQVPQLSESVAEGTLATWKKKIGDAIARDEILIDIETDKVALEVPSRAPVCWSKSSRPTVKPLSLVN